MRSVYDTFSDRVDQVKLLSKMYCNNSHIISYLKDYIRKNDNLKGYDPLYGRFTPGIDHPDSLSYAVTIVDSLKLSYIEKLISEAQEDLVPLVFILSPRYYKTITMERYSPVLQLSQQYNIPFINNINLEGFVGHAEFFQDNRHLNDVGANEYSKAVVSQLRDYIASTENH